MRSSLKTELLKIDLLAVFKRISQINFYKNYCENKIPAYFYNFSGFFYFR